MQEGPPTLSCQETHGTIWDIMDSTSYVLDLAPSPFPLFDHLNDDFRNLFVKTDARIRCIVRKAESASFQKALRCSFEVLGRRYIQEGGDQFD